MRARPPPAFDVFSAIPRDGSGEDWLRIGMAVPHRDGRGFDLTLQALPLGPKLVLRDCSEEPARAPTPSPAGEIAPPRVPLKQQVDAFERALIEQSLREAGGRITTAMERLGLPLRTLSEKMARLGINRRRVIEAAAASGGEPAGGRVEPRQGVPGALQRSAIPPQA